LAFQMDTRLASQVNIPCFLNVPARCHKDSVDFRMVKNTAPIFSFLQCSDYSYVALYLPGSTDGHAQYDGSLPAEHGPYQLSNRAQNTVKLVLLMT
jgi:hypothetical protein